MTKLLPLNFDSGINRLMVGLMWEPNENRAGVLGTIKEHDLDLSCALFDGNNEFFDLITPQEPKRDAYGVEVFHSGDNLSGGSDFEDEEIRVDFDKLNENIHALAFFVTTNNKIKFEDVREPACHFSDATSLNEIIKFDLTELSKKFEMPEHFEKERFLIGVVKKNQEGTWDLINYQTRVTVMNSGVIAQVVQEVLAK